MFPANAFRIYLASAQHSDALKSLAGQPLEGRVLVGEIEGTPAAALSLVDGRVIADPARKTDRLVATLRMRASGIRAYEATPSLRQRLRAALAAYRDEAIVVPASVWRDGHADGESERWAA
jgi:hypothetical protein